MKLSAEDRARIKRMRKRGETLRAIAAAFGVAYGTIQYALKAEAGRFADGRTPAGLRKRKAQTRRRQGTWYDRNRDRILASRKETAKAEVVRARVRAASRKRRGTPNATGEMKSGPCDACGEVCEKLNFDHCHATGAHRGWLCRSCNMALGYVRDCAQRLRSLIAYLERT